MYLFVFLIPSDFWCTLIQIKGETELPIKGVKVIHCLSHPSVGKSQNSYIKCIVTTSDIRGPSSAIIDHQQHSGTINDYQKLPMTFKGLQQPSLTIITTQDQSATTIYIQGPSTTISDHQHLSLTLRNHHRHSMPFSNHH